MFQSVAPCPGKIDFQIEPFPVPVLEVLPEADQVAELPVDALVAVSSEITEPCKEKTIILEESPFSMTAETEEEGIFLDESTTSEELLATISDIIDEVIPEEEEGKVVFSVVEPEPEASVEESAVAEEDKATPLPTAEFYSTGAGNPFDQSPLIDLPEEAAEPVEAVDLEVVVAEEETVGEEQPLAETEPTKQSPVVASWEPPVSAGKKKKGLKRKGLFRR